MPALPPPHHDSPHSNRAYLLVLTAEAAELYATRRADFSRDDHGEGEVEGSGGSEGTLAAMRAAVMDPLQVWLVVNGGMCARPVVVTAWLQPACARLLQHAGLASVSHSLLCNTDVRCAKILGFAVLSRRRMRCPSLCSRACRQAPGR